MISRPDFWRGIWLKTERAKEHVRELETKVGEFMLRRPYRAVIVREDETGQHVISAQASEQPPVWWGAIAGDAVHNLRSALDLMVYELVLANGATPHDGTGFPIADGPAEYAALREASLRGVSGPAAEQIDRLRPYRSGNTALWRLHQLDAANEQLGLRPVAAAAKGPDRRNL